MINLIHFMEFRKIVKNIIDFMIKRFIELLGLIISVAGLLLLAALLSYSPEDPNFVFTSDKEIQNILGYKGSVASDIFFQTIGYISILVSLTIFITGINVFRNKKTVILIENLFFTILYSLFGCLFFSFFSPESFWLSINGSGGFVGNFLQNTFLFTLVDLNPKISFYFFLFIIFLIFLLSISQHATMLLLMKHCHLKQVTQKIYHYLKKQMDHLLDFLIWFLYVGYEIYFCPVAFLLK